MTSSIIPQIIRGFTGSVLLAITFALWGCSSSSNNDKEQDLGGTGNQGDIVTLKIDLSGDQEVPPVDGAASGNADFSVDQTSGDISGKLTVSGLTGDASGAHIHAGDAGQNGGVVIGLEQDATDPAIWAVPAASTLDATQKADLLAGKMYVNVHTADNPGGEIRGQIVPSGYTVIRVSLTGENENPPVTTGAGALAYLTINTEGNREIRGSFRTSDLDDASAAHIHAEFAGINGEVVTAFTQDTADTTFWTLDDTTALTQEQMDQLLAGGMYINVHSPANASGEVRGQIAPDGIAVVRSELSGDQEVPAVLTTGSGIGYATVDQARGVVTANIRTDQLSSAANAAHIHEAPAGSNGGVAIGLEQDSADDALWLSAAGTTLNSTQLDAFNNNGLYFNVHTSVNGGGEIRGQIVP